MDPHIVESDFLRELKEIEAESIAALGAGCSPARERYKCHQGRADDFNYIEMIYNPKCRHNTSGGVCPVAI